MVIDVPKYFDHSLHVSCQEKLGVLIGKMEKRCEHLVNEVLKQMLKENDVHEKITQIDFRKFRGTEYMIRINLVKCLEKRPDSETQSLKEFMVPIRNPLLHTSNKVTEGYYAEKFYKSEGMMYDMAAGAVKNAGEVFHDPVGYCQEWERKEQDESKE